MRTQKQAQKLLKNSRAFAQKLIMHFSRKKMWPIGVKIQYSIIKIINLLIYIYFAVIQVY